MVNDDGEAGPHGYPECLLPHVGFEKNPYADFAVCPTAPDREGEMRPVCIESASHMVTEEFFGQGDDRRIQKMEGICSDP